MKWWLKWLCLFQVSVMLVFLYSQHVLVRSAVDKRLQLRDPHAAFASPSPAGGGGGGGAADPQAKVSAWADAVRKTKANTTRVSYRSERNAQAAEKSGVATHFTNESILIALASYGDMECGPTVERAYKRAAYPDRVFFGIHQQHNCTGQDVDGTHCLDCIASIHDQLDCPNHPLCTRVWQVRVSRQPMMETRGVTFGRFMAEKHYRGETYVMNIDSHSHFSRGWDSEIIDMFHRIGDDHALITTYPSHYGGTHAGHDPADNFEVERGSTDMCICQTQRVPVFKSFNFKHVMGTIRRPSKPIRSAFLAAGFNFAKGHRTKTVPYDPHTPFLFDGEETSFGVRAWTHGYDFYHPDKSIVAHLYISAGSKLRPVFWSHDWATRYKVQYQSVLRINKFLGLHERYDSGVPLENINLQDEDLYTVGKVRTVEQYWKWSKVDEILSPRMGDKSSLVCAAYEAGGMPKVHRPGIDP